MDNETKQRVRWLEDKLLRSKDFKEQLKLHNEIVSYLRDISRKKHALL